MLLSPPARVMNRFRFTGAVPQHSAFGVGDLLLDSAQRPAGLGRLWYWKSYDSRQEMSNAVSPLKQ
jgi:hypothetical protein